MPQRILYFLRRISFAPVSNRGFFSTRTYAKSSYFGIFNPLNPPYQGDFKDLTPTSPSSEGLLKKKAGKQYRVLFPRHFCCAEVSNSLLSV